MKILAIPVLALASCRGPDRWSTSVARSEGSAGSSKVDFDTEETTLEVGISGPIGSPPDRRYPVMPAWTPLPVQLPPSAPGEETDWVTLAVTIGVAVSTALAGVKYIPSKAFKGPFDKESA